MTRAEFLLEEISRLDELVISKANVIRRAAGPRQVNPGKTRLNKNWMAKAAAKKVTDRASRAGGMLKAFHKRGQANLTRMQNRAMAQRLAGT